MKLMALAILIGASLVLAAMSPKPTAPPPSSPYSVISYGAKCDGKTDDTAAFTATAQAQIANGGVMLIPSEPAACVTSLTAFSSTAGPSSPGLYVDDENDLLITGGAISGANVYIEGKAADQHKPGGGFGTFNTRPHVNWIARDCNTSAFATTALMASKVVGIAFSGCGYVPTANLLTDSKGNGNIELKFEDDQFLTLNVCNAAPFFVGVGNGISPLAAIAGFNITFDGDSFDCAGSGGNLAQFQDFSYVTFSGRNWFQNGGVEVDCPMKFGPTCSNVTFSGVLSEGLPNGGDFLYIDAGGSDVFAFSINDIAIADAASPYLVRVDNGNLIGFAMSTNFSGPLSFADPASTGLIAGVECHVWVGCPRLGGPIQGISSIISWLGPGNPAYTGSVSNNSAAGFFDAPNYPASITASTGVQSIATQVSGLGPCTALTEGTRRSVVDASAPSFGDVVVGGAGAHVAVYCNGSIWIVD